VENSKGPRQAANLSVANEVVQAKQITKEDQSDASKWPDIGSDEDTLRSYKLDHATVINSAERTQDRAQRFIPRGLDNLGELFMQAAKEPQDDRSNYLTYFNVPGMTSTQPFKTSLHLADQATVCDLNKLDTLDIYKDRLTPSTGSVCKKADSKYSEVMKVCVAHILAMNCRKLSLPGGEWPYQNNI
jgi:hypothetical protein